MFREVSVIEIREVLRSWLAGACEVPKVCLSCELQRCGRGLG